jgi:hypothetical protein
MVSFLHVSNQNFVCISHLHHMEKSKLKGVLLTPTANICNAMRRTTVEQKCGGGTWHIRAAVAEDIPSPVPVDVVYPTMRAWNGGRQYIQYWIQSYTLSFHVLYVHMSHSLEENSYAENHLGYKHNLVWKCTNICNTGIWYLWSQTTRLVAEF